MAPLVAAVAARTLETTLRMPMELLRTQMQASEASLSLRQAVNAQLQQPPHLWWRGYVPTLLRDVPFSALYWLTYERAKAKMEISEHWVPSPGLRTFLQSTSCGVGAGLLTALVTTPVDVIKTQRQAAVRAGKTPTYADICQKIHASPRAAFRGLGPRLLRIPAGLGAMMPGIEVTRWALERRRQDSA